MPFADSVAVTRVVGRLPRLAAAALMLILAIAGVRAILAPRSAAVASPHRTAPALDLSAEAFAQSFARAYLDWDSRNPSAYGTAVAPFVSSSLDAAAGTNLPSHGVQHVISTAVVADRPQGSNRIVTVAVGTSSGETDLAVTVARDQRGFLVVPTYPALVGPIATDTGMAFSDGDLVEDNALTAVANRAVVNYLRRDRTDLLADLSPGAVVVLPATPLRVLSEEPATWVTPNRRVAVVVQARRADGLELTLRYVLVVTRSGGRWFVARVMDTSAPQSKESP